MYILASIVKFVAKFFLNEEETSPTNDTYVNMYLDESNSLYTLDNAGNIVEFEGESE